MWSSLFAFFLEYPMSAEETESSSGYQPAYTGGSSFCQHFFWIGTAKYKLISGMRSHKGNNYNRRV